MLKQMLNKYQKKKNHIYYNYIIIYFRIYYTDKKFLTF